MILYLCPGSPDTLSGGTRKLYDHVAILNQRGLNARMIYNDDLVAGLMPGPDDIVVVPEVYGDGLRDFVPAGVRRVSFVQNGYLVERWGVADPDRHPFTTTPELEAVLTESAHTEALLTARFPDLPVPMIRTHSSGNGRQGHDAGFAYGAWPRKREVVYFDYKHEAVNAAVFSGLDLPEGWSVRTMTGMTDAEVAETLRTAAIFAAANTEEGMCAPTSEAMISGTVIVCWTGGGPDEYLTAPGGLTRGVIATQDDVPALRAAIEATARSIEADPDCWGALTAEWSDWFQATYSREAECAEIVAIFESLGQHRHGLRVNVGSGTEYADGWVNLDVRADDHTRCDRVVDPGDPFATFEPGSVERVYLGHVLEHLWWPDVARLLDQTRAVLAPGGEALVVGPDVNRLIHRFREGREPWWLVDGAIEHADREAPDWPEATHKWNCHEHRVVTALDRAGFVDVETIPPPAAIHERDGIPGWPVTGWAPWQCAVLARNP